jgi:hypothetical protein
MEEKYTNSTRQMIQMGWGQTSVSAAATTM